MYLELRLGLLRLRPEVKPQVFWKNPTKERKIGKCVNMELKKQNYFTDVKIEVSFNLSRKRGMRVS